MLRAAHLAYGHASRTSTSWGLPYGFTTPIWETLKWRWSYGGRSEMSRGPGKIEQQLSKILKEDPSLIHSTADLCRQVYWVAVVEKKHRVAVLRALKTFSRKAAPWLWRDVAVHERSDDSWYDFRTHPASGRNRAPADARRPAKR